MLFGAKGDGATPDSAAIQAALDAAGKVGGTLIENLIKEKKLFVSIELSCKSVGLNISKIVPDDAKHVKFVVDKMAVDKNVSVIAYLVAREDFDLSCSDFSKAWTESSYFIQKNNVIGMSPKVTVPIQHKKAGSKSSIFSFQEELDLDELTPIKFKFTPENIIFIMPHNIYRSYVKIQRRRPDVVLSSIIIPTLTDILRQMKEEPGTEELNDFNTDNEDSKWYKVIVEKFKSIYEEEPQDSDVDPYKAAQQLVKNPLYGLFIQTRTAINREENE